ncbi:MAG: M3 family peptidase [Planctomycetes bacterium]|nr:M3 family peptidase [Planctomycetota bacterium]NOG55293.1 M3 family metallopeptidase [Planctomycetota bacterium]
MPTETTNDITTTNPLLARSGLPCFNTVQPAHVEPAVTATLEELDRYIANLESSAEPTWEGLLKPLEHIGMLFEYTWEPVGHLLSVQNTPELRQVHETMQPKVVEAGLRILQSRPIYDALQAIKDDAGTWASFSEAQQRIVDDKVREAKLAGVGLDGSDKQRFTEIARTLSKIATDFSNHVLDATKAYELIITDPNDAEGWPSTLRQLSAQSYNQSRESADVEGEPNATPENGPWRVTLDFPSFGPFLEHCRNRDLRKQAYHAYVTRATEGDLDNTDLIRQTLTLRQEMANLLGYATYAEMGLESKMAPGVEAVDQMYADLRDAAKPRAADDLDDLRALAAESGQTEELAHWDIAFWAERLREQRFSFTDEQLRPYFPMPRVLDGLFGLCNRLFGITVHVVDNEPTVWHEDVRFYHVHNEDGQHVASFYLDPYSRPHEKRGGAWMDNCLGRRVVDGQLCLPVVHLCCNGTPPVGDKPSLMSFSEVRTLFHEFGHGLQGMMTTVDYADAAGLAGVEWDAVEIASQFMENWCYHKPTLVGMTQHFETGEPLPDDLFDKLVAARMYRQGSGVIRQMTFGISDMTLHHRYDPTADAVPSPIEIYQSVERDLSALPPYEAGRFLCAFSHIFAGGYAAGYYSYLWSEVLSADVFAAFEQVGLDNEVEVRRLGRKYRDTLLSLGGGRHPMDIFRDFRGREPSTEALLRHKGLKD